MLSHKTRQIDEEQRVVVGRVSSTVQSIIDRLHCSGLPSLTGEVTSSTTKNLQTRKKIRTEPPSPPSLRIYSSPKTSKRFPITTPTDEIARPACRCPCRLHLPRDVSQVSGGGAVRHAGAVRRRHGGPVVLARLPGDPEGVTSGVVVSLCHHRPLVRSGVELLGVAGRRLRPPAPLDGEGHVVRAALPLPQPTFQLLLGGLQAPRPAGPQPLFAVPPEGHLRRQPVLFPSFVVLYLRAYVDGGAVSAAGGCDHEPIRCLTELDLSGNETKVRLMRTRQ